MPPGVFPLAVPAVRGGFCTLVSGGKIAYIPSLLRAKLRGRESTVSNRHTHSSPTDLLRRMDEALERCRPHEPRPWLHGLAMREGDGTVEIIFPHALYERFFSPHRQLFETALRQCLPAGTNILYRTAGPVRPENLSAGSPLPEKTSARAPSVPATKTTDGLAPAGGQPPSLPGPSRTLDDFLCNAKNAFPLEVMRRIAGHPPGTVFQPLLLYGGSGTGKSHLLSAVGSDFSRQGMRVLSLPAARFCRQAEDWARQPESFWQDVHVLLLDDLQDIVGQEAWQGHLVTLLDHCPPQRQALFALTGTAQTFKRLQPRLVGRLESGLVTELLEPDLEIRLRYLQDICRQRQLPLSREEQLFLARRCRQFRLLQGMLLKVAAFAEMRQGSLSREDVENIARTGGTEPAIGHREIVEEISRLYALRPEEVLGNGRRPQLVLARQIAMYVCRRRLGLSYPELGRMFGGKDHSTVVHAVKKVKKMLESNKDVQNVVAALEKSAP